MTTETATTTETAANKDEYSFLGLYIKAELKNKISEKAKSEERSMSKFAGRIFEQYFAENA